MSEFQVHLVVAFLLVGIGVHAMVVRANLLRKIMALNVAGAGIFLLLVAIAHASGEEGPDPVPQALVLTGIVITVSVTAFALSLLRRYYESTGSTRLGEQDEAE